MGKASRDKGARFERECVHILRDAGLQAERVPLSGAAGGKFHDDIHVWINDTLYSVECKKRARAWTDLYRWLDGPNALIIAKDREEPLIVMTLKSFLSEVTNDNDSV